MTKSEIKSALSAAITAAKAAGALMRKNLHVPKKINAETPHDIKLELDVRCQELIEKILRREFPDIALLGEEGDSGVVTAEHRWVVDPIDGTVNFAYGIPHAAVSIALQARSKSPPPQMRLSPSQATCDLLYKTLLGVVYDPFTDELWTAMRGAPARLNGRIIHVSRRGNLDEAIVSIGFSKTKVTLTESLPYFCRVARRTRKVRILGSAALALTYVATGRLDAYIERRISLWDIAAGGLIVECAGGEFQTKPVSGHHRFSMVTSNGLLRSQLPSL